MWRSRPTVHPGDDDNLAASNNKENAFLSTEVTGQVKHEQSSLRGMSKKSHWSWISCRGTDGENESVFVQCWALSPTRDVNCSHGDFYLSDERQPQQEANDSDEQRELHPVSGTPQLLWEQVSDGCGQGLYSYELAATHVRVSVIIRSWRLYFRASGVLIKACVKDVPVSQWTDRRTWGRRAQTKTQRQVSSTEPPEWVRKSIQCLEWCRCAFQGKFKHFQCSLKHDTILVKLHCFLKNNTLIQYLLLLLQSNLYSLVDLQGHTNTF